MHPTVEEFRRRAQDRYGFDVDIREFADGMKTAVDATEVVGTSGKPLCSS